MFTNTTRRSIVPAFIEHVVPATRFGPSNPEGRQHWRAVGSTDIDGKGTRHAIASIDPFVFLDESLNPSSASGLGGHAHPHAGLTAITFLCPDARPETAHGALQPWDNQTGETSQPNNAGGLYIIESNRGAVHEERNVTPEGSTMHQLQLWTMPLDLGNVAQIQQRPPTSRLYQPDEVPLVVSEDRLVRVRVLIGQQFGETSPAMTSNPLLYLHVHVKGGGATFLRIPAGFAGFVYVLVGTGRFAGVEVAEREVAVLGHGESARSLSVEASDSGVNFILAAGQPRGAGFAKLLGHGGAMVAADEDAARALMLDFEQRGIDDFGKNLEN